MFYQDGDPMMKLSTHLGARVRIFYPSGNVEWASLQSKIDPDESSLFFKLAPCYLYNKKTKNIKQAMALAEEYDKKMGFPKMKFLGEL